MIFVGDLWVQVQVSLGMKERTPAQRGAWWAEGCLVSDRSRRRSAKITRWSGRKREGMARGMVAEATGRNEGGNNVHVLT